MATADALKPAFRTLFEGSRDALFLGDATGHCLEVNTRALALTGLPREALLGRPLTELLDEQGLLCRDGRRARVAVSRQAISPAEVLVFVQDLERVRLEAELVQVNRLYALLSQVNQSVLHFKDRVSLLAAACQAAIDFGFRMAWAGLLDADGVVQPVAKAGQTDGYLDGLRIDTRDEALSRGPTGLAVREGRLDVCADIAGDTRMLPWRERALAQGFHASAAIPLRTGSRVVGAISLYAAEPGFFSERECALLAQVGQDLSFAFESFDAALERERLREQLDQSRKLEAIGRLAGGVAHDFNNFLTVIIAGVESALVELSPGHPAREDLEESLDAAQRSTALTRRLLTVARKTRVSLTTLDLNANVEQALPLLRRLVGETATLRFLPQAGLWPVLGDAIQLDQVLTNLCVNARDALHPGGTITVSTANLVLDQAEAVRRAQEPGAFVTLSVADDGAGMSPEVQSRLFEPFFTTKAAGKGTGLGLATVYGVVKQGGGHITVDSAPGRGSTFTVFFPRVPQKP